VAAAFAAGVLIGHILSSRSLRRFIVLGSTALAGFTAADLMRPLRTTLRRAIIEDHRPRRRASSFRDIQVRLGNVESLTAALPSTKYAWAQHICTQPVTLLTDFAPAASEEEFFATNFLDPSRICIDLELRPLYRSIRNPDNLAAMALYKSGAVRSLPAEIHVDEPKLEVLVDDRLFLLDPDAPEAQEIAKGIRDEVTVFVVECEEI
jgi:hypothetical protein